MYDASNPQATARGFINNAYGSQVNGDTYAAQVWLARALQADPTLKDDPSVRDLASKLTGLPAEEALRRLTTPAKASGGEQSRTRDSSAGDSGDTVLILLVEVIVLFVVTIVSTLIIQAIGRTGAQAIMEQIGTRGMNAQTRQTLLTFLSAKDGSTILSGAISSAVGTLVGFSLWGLLIYLFTTMALGGVGGVVSHFSVLMRINIVSTIVLTIGIALFFGAFTGTVATQKTLLPLVPIILGADAIGTLVAEIYLVSRVHDIDMFKGCVAVVLSPFIVSCGCVLITIAAGMLSR